MLTETPLRIPFSVIGFCSLVPTCHWLHGKCTRINLSQEVSGVILQNHWRRLHLSILSVKIVALGSLKVGTNENGSACGRWLSIGI
jgi:hypothetical protein